MREDGTELTGRSTDGEKCICQDLQQPEGKMHKSTSFLFKHLNLIYLLPCRSSTASQGKTAMDQKKKAGGGGEEGESVCVPLSPDYVFLTSVYWL